MTSPVRVGILGAGLMAHNHARSSSRLTQVQSLAFYDAQHEKAEQSAAEFGGQSCNSLAELMAQCEIVWICTPPFVRLEPILAACESKRAIFCEKPLALNLNEISTIRQAVQAAQIPFYMGQSNRFLEVFQKMHQLVARGTIGEPMSLWSKRMGWLDVEKTPPWRLDNALGGGTIIEQGVHEIDFMRWLGGEWREVYAHSSSRILRPGTFEESVFALGTLQSGVTARVEVSWASPRYVWQRGIDGSEGSLFFDDSQIEQIELHRAGKTPEIFRVSG